MRLKLLCLTLVLTACGSDITDAGKFDPSLLFNNHLSYPVYLTWQDGNAIVGYDTIPAGAMGHCSHFDAQADSAYFQIIATDYPPGLGAQTSTITAPWFHPLARPAWTVDVTANGNASPLILIQETDVMCVASP